MEFVYKSQAEIAEMTDEQREDYAVKKRAHEEALIEKKAKEEAEKLIEKAKEEAKKETEDLLQKSKEEAEKKAKVLTDRVDKMSAELKKRNQMKKRHEEASTFSELLQKAVNENEDDIQKFIRKEKKSLVLELKAVGDITTANVDGDNYGRITEGGIVYLPSRKAYVSDMISQGVVGAGNDYYFMRETGSEGEIKPVAEGDEKPQFDLDLEEANVPIETIAGWMRVTRKALQNIPGFTSWLNLRVPDLFKKVLDYNVLYGSGSDNEFTGIMNAANSKALDSDSTVFIEKIIDAITQLEDTYERDADIGFLRPKEYNSLFKNKADGSGVYDLPEGVTFNNGVLYVLGTPIYKTTSLDNSDFLIGQRNGAQLLTQNPMVIELFEQDGDNVRYNKVTVRVEGDYALPVYGDDFFVRGSASND